MNKLLCAAALVITLSACGHSDAENARREMEHSKAAYKSCLSDNTDDASQCDGLKHAYDADLSAYGQVSNADK